MNETKTVTLTVTWRSTHTLTVPAGSRCPATLDELMDLVRADPDILDGDITADQAEPVDWDW